MRALVAAAALGALLAGCAAIQTEPWRPPGTYPEPEGAASGAELYARDCAFCHGSDGSGTARGPDLLTGTNGPALTDFMLRTGRMPIDHPNDPTERRDPVYDDAEIAALVSYLDDEFDQPGPAVPELNLAAGDLPEGQRVYQENCAACHATTGIGGAMLVRTPQTGIEGVTIPGLGRSTPLEVAEAVRTGPGTMPVFSEAAITDAELDSLVAYVATLPGGHDRGGWGLGHVGPVAEGAAGWVLGLGLLVAFIWWIGTRAGERP